MRKYRRLPIEIEAERVTWQNRRELASWCGGSYYENQDDFEIQIHTPEGILRALEGDWIIKGVNGEFYPCKNDIFQKTYERAW